MTAHRPARHDEVLLGRRLQWKWAELLRRLGLAMMIAAGLGGGFWLGGPNTPPQAAAASGPILRTDKPSAPLGIDLDGDGRLDLARPVNHALRGVDAYGSGAFGAARDGGRRAHAGVDLVSSPGEPVRAPISGTVTRVGAAYAGDDALQYVEISDPRTRYLARILYVGPVVIPGSSVAAGDVIGAAQSLAARYPLGMTNHVHVELTSHTAGRLNPLAVLPRQVGSRADRPAA